MTNNKPICKRASRCAVTHMRLSLTHSARADGGQQLTNAQRVWREKVTPRFARTGAVALSFRHLFWGVGRGFFQSLNCGFYFERGNMWDRGIVDCDRPDLIQTERKATQRMRLRNLVTEITKAPKKPLPDPRILLQSDCGYLLRQHEVCGAPVRPYYSRMEETIYSIRGERFMYEFYMVHVVRSCVLVQRLRSNSEIPEACVRFAEQNFSGLI